MDKEDVVCTHTWILPSHKKEWNCVICSNMDRPRDYHATRSKLERQYYLYVKSKICYKWTYLQNRNRLKDIENRIYGSVQFTQPCPTLCDPMDCSTSGLPVHHQLLEFTQTHVHWVGDAIQPSHPLSSPSPTFNLSQHQSLFRWVSSSPQVAIVLEFQLQHQAFQWTPRTDLL